MLGFVGKIEAVTGFDLDRRHPLGEQRVEAGERAGDQLGFAGGARGLHGRYDAAAGARDILVARALEPQFEFVCSVPAVNEVGVAVDQPGRDPPAVAVDPFRGIEGRRVGGGAGIGDRPVAAGDHAVLDVAQPLTRHRREARIVPEAVAEHRHGLSASRGRRN